MKKEKRAFQALSELFSVLSNPSRLKIITLLQKEEMDVSHIQQALAVSQSSVSQHLTLLKRKGLVDERKVGKHVFYRLKGPQVACLLQAAVQYLSMDLMMESEAVVLTSELLALLRTV